MVMQTKTAYETCMFGAIIREEDMMPIMETKAKGRDNDLTLARCFSSGSMLQSIRARIYISRVLVEKKLNTHKESIVTVENANPNKFAVGNNHCTAILHLSFDSRFGTH